MIKKRSIIHASESVSLNLIPNVKVNAKRKGRSIEHVYQIVEIVLTRHVKADADLNLGMVSVENLYRKKH
jgi:hypothetical protein